jgi:hypothetical protein
MFMQMQPNGSGNSAVNRERNPSATRTVLTRICIAASGMMR